jgi:hypothetical protein
MRVPAIFHNVEQSGFSHWIRGSDPISITDITLLFHVIGMSTMLGANVIVDLQILGGLPTLPLKSLRGLFRIMWRGLAFSILTGALLLAAYPTKELTNPVFYIKLCFLTLSLAVMHRLETQVSDPLLQESQLNETKWLAISSLVLWFVALTCGRLLAYTYRYLSYGHPTS